MTSLSEMLAWIASHANKLRRKDYEPPNHLANGTVRYFGADGPTFDLELDANGLAPDYSHEPPPTRIEIYSGSGELLFTEDA
jgi:hypothetical protein